MTVRRHALQRSQQLIRLSGPRALEKRRRQLGFDELAETEQQFQLPIEGVATSWMVFATTTLTFDVDFFDAPEQRDAPFAVPHFTYGAFIAATETGDGGNPSGAVMVVACVQEWVTDTRGAITGAKVAVGTGVPGFEPADGDWEVPFTGYVHLTFQGYGAPTENSTALDVGT